MVKYLLDAGANVSERCFGTFMSPEDQKASRSDNTEHEWVDVNPMTNYDGYVYWGEYPLSFAACLGQEECYRLVLARGAECVFSFNIFTHQNQLIFNRCVLFFWFSVRMLKTQMEIQRFTC